MKADQLPHPKTKTSMSKAIKEKCLDCCCGNRKEIETCQITRCALWLWRFGKPDGAIRRGKITQEEFDQYQVREVVYSEAQLKAQEIARERGIHGFANTKT